VRYNLQIDYSSVVRPSIINGTLAGRLKSLVVPDEPLTPGILYVGVATLTGSIISRNRFITTRLFLPPLFLLVSLNHFLPKTSHNLSLYFSELEERYAPSLKEKHDIANAHTRMTWERAKEATKDGREGLSKATAGLVERVQDATGLKLRETLGWGEQVQEKAKGKAVARVQAAKDAIDKKAEDVKRLV
jgi:MICOS complex subunit MIC26